MKLSSMKGVGLPWWVCAVLMAGCATAPQRTHVPSTSPSQARVLSHQLAMRALSLLGRPYQYGGAGPDSFDCSGLVRFIHGELGIEVPRTTGEQYRAARPVTMAELKAGDVLFFRMGGSGVSHVAIYIGKGRFVHAPQSGRPVELRGLDDAFYRPRLVSAGRLF